MGYRIVRYVKPLKFYELTGYTVSAQTHKMDSGVWRKGREYILAPDGNRLVDLDGFEKWVEGIRR